MSPETKMPWDKAPQTTTTTSVKGTTYSATTMDTYLQNETSPDRKKYGAGKPYRKFIIGDIKSDSNK